MLQIKEHTEGVQFKIVVLPKSSRNMIAGLHGDALKVKITAPPVEGAANKMCLGFLSKLLKTPPSSLEIISGPSTKTKQILWRKSDGRAPSDQRQALLSLIAE